MNTSAPAVILTEEEMDGLDGGINRLIPMEDNKNDNEHSPVDKKSEYSKSSRRENAGVSEHKSPCNNTC